MKLFSDKHRPVHLGPYPLERLSRQQAQPDLEQVPDLSAVNFHPDNPTSIVHAMDEYQSMLDALRDGLVNRVRAECPDDLQERLNHLKGFGYFHDTSMIGACRLQPDDLLATPVSNPGVAALAEDLKHKQTSTLAAGIDVIMAELKESMEAPPTTIDDHTHAIVFAVEFPREPGSDETGCEWIQNAQEARACLRASETAVVIANYLRVLGFRARAHSGTDSDVNLNRLAVKSGLVSVEEGVLDNPYLGNGFGLAAVTTEFEMAVDAPLAPRQQQDRSKSHGLAWKLGKGFTKNAGNQLAYADRLFKDGPFPFEKLKRVDQPTTYIDEDHVARVPKRTDMFARAQFGDMGKKCQAGATRGKYVSQAPSAAAKRRALGAFTIIQNGEAEPHIAPGTDDPQRNADNIKAACYFIGADAVGISRCPEWAYYSHNARGLPIDPYHVNAVSIIIDQGYDTMEGASGDDWISVSQSMRAYLRFSLLGGVLAKHLRNLGYSARAHTVIDGEVLQPPLLLLAGLGEVSRIGEVILNPYLGPRLKSGVVTTNMPVTFDKPIDFGLQTFCEGCNKCARECPSGAITAGPKLMFNGYEIWKSDSQKCATYRITTEGGAMCGRCMKTCPWNLSGLFSEKPFQWLAMKAPKTAPWLEKLDDAVGNGGLNPVKKWWWDLKLCADGGYRPTDRPVNERDLQTDLDLKYEDQTLAVYPAPLAPHPWPYPYLMDREKGIQAYQQMVSAAEYRSRLQRGDTEGLFHECRNDTDSPVQMLEIREVKVLTPDISCYVFAQSDNAPLPPWEAGAHLDIVVAPEYLRQYSMCGDPNDRSYYEIAVLREDEGRGGSALMHRIFNAGRVIFSSNPINHFPLDETASKTYLMGGGIGVTPMVAMAHRLHQLGADFELHYSVHSRDNAGFRERLESVPWSDRVTVHISKENGRADLAAILSGYEVGNHVYTCGPDDYMQAVLSAAEQGGYPEEARHLEYFSVPETPDYVNYEFTLRLKRSGKELLVRADQVATDVLQEAGIGIDVKCSDGLCGVCQCRYLSGDVEHRDFVLSSKQQKDMIILCQSRAREEGGILELDL